MTCDKVDISKVNETEAWEILNTWQTRTFKKKKVYE